MTELKGFYNEEVLDGMLYDGRIGKTEYIFHHSEEMKEAFMEFCRIKGLDIDDDTADIFFQDRLKKEETAHTPDLD